MKPYTAVTLVTNRPNTFALMQSPISLSITTISVSGIITFHKTKTNGLALYIIFTIGLTSEIIHAFNPA